MLLSHSQPRKRHSSKTLPLDHQPHNDTLPEMHPAVPGYKATKINFPAHSGEIQWFTNTFLLFKTCENVMQ